MEVAMTVVRRTWWWNVPCSSCSRSLCSMDTDTATQSHSVLCHSLRHST